MRLSALESKLPEVERASEALQKVAEHWPQISEAVNHLKVLQDKLPELEQAALLIADLDANFGKVESVLDKASDRLTEAHKVVNAALTALPKVDTLSTAGNDFGVELQRFTENSSAAFEAIPQVIEQNLFLLQQTNDSIVQLAKQLQGNDSDSQAMLKALKVASTRLEAGSNMLEHTLSLLTAVNALSSDIISVADIRSLRELKNQLDTQKSLVSALTSSFQSDTQVAIEKIEQLSSKAGDSKTTLEKVLSRFDTAISPAIKNMLDQLTTATGNVATAFQEVPERLPELGTILEETAAAIESGQSSLLTLQQNFPVIRETIHTAVSGVSEKTQNFSAFVRDVLPLIQSSMPAAEEKIQQVVHFAQEDLPTVEEKIHLISNLIRTGLPHADKGVEIAARLVRDDLPVLEESVRKAASTIRQIKDEIDLEEIAQLLSGDIKSKSDFLANPVVLKENKLYPIPNYGSAMTPFYVVLSLWVGGTLLISLLRTGVDSEGRKYKMYQMYFGRLFTFLTVGILQAMVATLGNIFILKCYVVDKTWFVLFGVLISIVFVTIVFTLVSVFGNLGKGIAIVFMVLQFSSSGGTFPISTTGRFFQTLYPFMPFTYAISLMREAVGGILPEVVIRDVLYLIGFTGLALLLALTLKKPLERYIHKAAEQAERSKLIS